MAAPPWKSLRDSHFPTAPTTAVPHLPSQHFSISLRLFSLTHFNPARGIRCDRALPRLDTSLTWQPREHLSFSVAGQNLLQDHHVEFNSAGQTALSSLVKRSVYAKFVWRF